MATDYQGQYTTLPLYGYAIQRWSSYVQKLTSSQPIIAHNTPYGDQAAQCIITADKLAFLGLHLTFSSKPCLAEWCVSSELTTDLLNTSFMKRNGSQLS